MMSKGCTDEEIDDAKLGIHTNAIRIRRGENVERVFMTAAMGEKRETKSGNDAIVYHITETGVRALGLAEYTWCVPDKMARDHLELLARQKAEKNVVKK